MINVPNDKHSVVSEDGRIFYDLQHLLDHYRPIIETSLAGARALDLDVQYFEGQEWLLRQIQSAHDQLALNGSLAETE